MAIKLSATRLDLGTARLDNANLRAYSETLNALGNVSGATTINLASGAIVTATATAATTWSVTNVPSTSAYCTFTLVLTNGGRFTQTWMSGTKWQNSSAPTLSVLGTDVITFFTVDGGTTWQGSVTMLNSSGGSQLFVWGYNTSGGRLGLGDTLLRSSPTQLSGTWAVTAMGTEHATHLKSDGSLWAVGANSFGSLGVNDTTARSSPVQITGTWITVSTGNHFSGAIKPDGTLWTWGYNRLGGPAAGIGSLGDQLVPIQVGSDTSWLSISAGRLGFAALKTDGSLWMWGRNASGNLGQGDTAHRSSPVQVAGTWSVIHAGYHFTLAARSNGTLWAWGRNTNGELGLGDTIERSSPVQVALGSWVEMGGYTSAFAINSSGQLWVSGRGTSGELGLGNTVNRSSPVQVDGTWVKVGGGGWSNTATMATRTDKSLWVWGAGPNGELGLGDTIKRSSPVQMPGTWSGVFSETGLNQGAFSALKSL